MRYIYSSPLYNIPIPRIYGWDLTFDNPVGAPYILRECVKGTNLSTDGRFYGLSPSKRMQVIKELAFVQAELSKPSEFKQLGYIYQREDNEDEFYVGKVAALPSGCPEEDARRQPFLGPYDSLPELWEARIDRETLSAIGNWSQLPSDSSLPPHLGPPSKANPQEFGELLQLLAGLTNLFNPPAELSTLCIHHSDFALRNVLFDEETMKISGVIDWEFASVMPLCITGRFPNDLGWEGNEFAKSMGKLGKEADMFNHHYYDWTSLSGVAPPPRACGDIPSPPASPAHPSMRDEDYLTSPNASANGCVARLPDPEFFGEEGVPSPPSPPLPAPPTYETSQQEVETRASNLIQLYYYRKYYASRVAFRDFTLTRMFMDSVAYIKFNEIVTGGAEKWFGAADWIKEVYFRFQALDSSVRDDLVAGKGIVRVPERFEYERRVDVDLGELEKRPMCLR